MISIDDINGLTSEFNSLLSYPYSDYLVTKVFAQQINPYTHYERVAILDALFDTKLRQSRPIAGRARKSLFEISDNIRCSLDQLAQAVVSLGEHDLFALDLTNTQVKESILNALKIVLSCLNNNSLSFTGKYLHFVFPRVFPIWDKLVPQAINAIYTDKIFPKTNINTSSYYLLLCQKYQEIACQFTHIQINEIQQNDYDSQPEGWRVTNTFVRILDKALWMYEKRNVRNAV